MSSYVVGYAANSRASVCCSYVVGYAGWSGMLAIFGFCNLVAVLTAMSFSAIVTNGNMGGGGVYYMISRSMGQSITLNTIQVYVLVQNGKISNWCV